MSRTKCPLVLVAILLVPGLALAQEGAPKWGYIEGGLIDYEPDQGLSDDGWYAVGSMNLLKNFHLVAEYNDVGEYTFWNAGGGWHGLFGEKADLFAQVMWANIEVDSSNIDESGYDVEAGIRWKFIKWFELLGQVNWVDYGDAGDDTTVEAGVLFTFLNDRIGVGATWETGDADTARGFFRFNFGK